MEALVTMSNRLSYGLTDCKVPFLLTVLLDKKKNSIMDESFRILVQLWEQQPLNAVPMRATRHHSTRQQVSEVAYLARRGARFARSSRRPLFVEGRPSRQGNTAPAAIRLLEPASSSESSSATTAAIYTSNSSSKSKGNICGVSPMLVPCGSSSGIVPGSLRRCRCHRSCKM